MNWTDATLNAVIRYAQKHQTLMIPRSELIAEEIENVIRDTATLGKTPESSLNYYLQKLRDEGYILFLERGRYLLIDKPLNPDAYGLSDKELNHLAETGKLLFDASESLGSTTVQTRRKIHALREAVSKIIDGNAPSVISTASICS